MYMSFHQNGLFGLGMGMNKYLHEGKWVVFEASSQNGKYEQVPNKVIANIEKFAEMMHFQKGISSDRWRMFLWTLVPIRLRCEMRFTMKNSLAWMFLELTQGHFFIRQRVKWIEMEPNVFQKAGWTSFDDQSTAYETQIWNKGSR